MVVAGFSAITGTFGGYVLSSGAWVGPIGGRLVSAIGGLTGVPGVIGGYGITGFGVVGAGFSAITGTFGGYVLSSGAWVGPIGGRPVSAIGGLNGVSGIAGGYGIPGLEVVGAGVSAITGTFGGYVLSSGAWVGPIGGRPVSAIGGLNGVSGIAGGYGIPGLEVVGAGVSAITGTIVGLVFTSGAWVGGI